MIYLFYIPAIAIINTSIAFIINGYSTTMPTPNKFNSIIFSNNKYYKLLRLLPPIAIISLYIVLISKFISFLFNGARSYFK